MSLLLRLFRASDHRDHLVRSLDAPSAHKTQRGVPPKVSARSLSLRLAAIVSLSLSMLAGVGSGTVQASQGFQIGGTVTGPNGVGLSGISVGSRDDSGIMTWHNTQSGGAYSFYVSPGDYAILFQDFSGSHVDGCYSNSAPDHFTGNQNACSIISVTTSAVLGVDVVMPLGVHINGVVFGGPGETPLENIGVNAQVGQTYGYSTSSGTNGAYSITVLPGTDYTIHFFDGNGTYINGCYASGAVGNFTTNQNLCSTVGVTTGDVGDFNVTMPRGLHIRGTVSGPDEVGLLGIWAGPATGNGNILGWYNTQSDGAYSFAVSPGDYKVLFHDPSGNRVEGCYSSSAPGHFTADRNACSTVSVTTSDVLGIDIVMPLGVHISGIVFGPGETPLEGINVHAKIGQGYDYWAPSNVNGAYSITVMPGADYAIYFYDNAGTYISGCYDSGAVGNFTIDQSVCSMVGITTVDVSDINVTMPAGYRISGIVTGPDGQPLPNISVHASSNSFGADAGTQENGTYSIAVPAGNYVVQFRDNSGLHLNGCYVSNAPGHFGTDQNTCTPVAVTTVDVSNINVTMPSGYRISGIVTGPDGQPLPSISVHASSNSFSADAGTQEDGTYLIAVPAGNYVVQFRDNSGLHLNGCYVSNAPGHFSTDQNACTPVAVTTGDVGGINIQMSLGQRISGTVSGSNGQPLGSIWVGANSNDYNNGTNTQEDGTYSIVVPAGDYTVQFHDNSGAYVDGCYLSDGIGHFSVDQNTCTPVAVTTDDVGGINVQMSLGHRISGTVTGHDGQPLSNVNVNAFSDNFNTGTNTQEDGTYSITVPAGDYTVQFHDNSGAYVDGRYSIGDIGHINVNVSQNVIHTPVVVTTDDVGGINVQMSLGMYISGTVTGPDGQPLGNINVSANSNDYGNGTNTQEDGTYSIMVPSGDYMVQFHDNSGPHLDGCYLSGGIDHFSADQNTCTLVAVTTNDVPNISVTMPAGYRISGTVTDSNGQPLTNVNVNANSNSFNTGTGTQEDGTYSLSVPSGDYTLWFNDNSGVNASGCYVSGAPGHFGTNQNTCTSVAVTTDDVGGINVQMSPGIRISGTVSGPDGQPLGNVWVGANSNDYGNGTNTQEDGTYSITVPSGSYTINLIDNSGTHVNGCYSGSAPGHFTPDWGNCDLVPATDENVTLVDIAMPLGHRISGTVTGSSGQPLANVDVWFDASTFGVGQRTDDNGNYSLTVLPGTYTVSFHDETGTYPGGCYASGGFTTNWSACTPVVVTTSDRGGINVQMSIGTTATHFTVSVVNPYGAGTSHSVTVTALDAGGNVVTGYLGTVNFTSSDSQAVLPGNYTFTSADAGVHKFTTGLIFKTAGVQSLTAIDMATPSITGGTTTVVTPSVAKTLVVSGLTSPITAGLSGTLVVTVKDAYGNTATGYLGTVHFTSSDTHANLPGDYTFTVADAGVHNFSVALTTVGTWKVTATDTVKTTITGVQSGIVVTPGIATHFRVTIVSPYEAGTSHSVTVVALDAGGNVATGYTGTVNFASSDSQAALPANYTFVAADAGSKSVNGLTLRTAGLQSITATDIVTSINGGTTVTVTPTSAKTLVVSGLSSPRMAGVMGTLTVTVRDAYGNVATGYLGTVHFTSSDITASLPGNYAFKASDAGVHDFNVTLLAIGTWKVTVTDTVKSTITGYQSGIVVTAGTATHFGVSITSPYEAGMPHSVTVTALDAGGNVATGYTGTVHFGSSDSQAALPGNYTFTSSDAGVHKFLTGLILKTAGTQSVTASDLTISGSSNIVVTPTVAKTLVVSGLSSPRIAGVADTFTVTAKDAYGNVATGYLGTVHFTSSDTHASLPGDYLFTAANAGVHGFNITWRTIGTWKVTATDTVKPTITGSQSGIVVTIGAATHFGVSVVSPYEAGMPHSVTITALDAGGNVATGYTGTIHLSSSDSHAALPGNYTFTSADAGVHKFATGLILKTSGTQSITALDTGTSSIVGTTTTIVTPGGAKTLTISGLGSPWVRGVGDPFTVTAKDAYGNVATGYLGTVHFTSSDPAANFLINYAFKSSDAGVHNFIITFLTGGTWKVTATDTITTTITGSQSGIVITVPLDTTPPTLILPMDMTLEATSHTGNVVNFHTTTYDDIDPAPVLVCTAASGDTFPLGTTTISCTSTDASGNATTKTFKIVVVDSRAPALTVPDNITVEATNPAGTPVIFSATATDIADPAPSVVCTPPSGAAFPRGVRIVSCTATDASGNQSIGTFAVTVTDKTPPVLHLPSDITVAATDSTGAVVTFTVTATDNADSHPSIICAPPSGSLFPIGHTTVRCTAIDASGNSSEVTFGITVTG